MVERKNSRQKQTITGSRTSRASKAQSFQTSQENKFAIFLSIKSKIQQHKKIVIWALLLVFFFASVLLGGISYMNYQKLKNEMNQLITQKESIELSEKEKNDSLVKIREIFRLPEDESPKLLVVSNLNDKKKEDPFYRYAENGDIILVFSQAGRAILYRPAENKVIEVGKVETTAVNNEVAGANTTAVVEKTPTPSMKSKNIPEASASSIEIRHLPEKKEVAEEVKSKVQELLPNVKFSMVETESNPGKSNRVIDRTGRYKKDLEELSLWLGIESATDLTPSESNSTADIIIRILE